MEIFKLLGKIAISGADEAKNEVSETTEHAKRKGSELLGTVGKIGAAAVAAGSAAVLAVGKQALSAYADYEQLVGGVETLFEDLSVDVIENASNAYKTAGLSANEYMDTVMGFSASLNQSLLASEGNIARAAELSDQIIIDMSDNANKMGTDMVMIQNAYQGFAKQNYTMLDNLKLGYGGTKEEMQRLLEDAEKLSGIKYDISSFADIAEAIHVVQTEMGITGTTAKEASTTIQGSMNSMKGAWKNMLVGIADENADFKSLTGDFVDSLVTVGENIIPRVKIIIQGITQLVSQASQTIVPLVVQTLLENLPGIIAAGMDMVVALVNGILDNSNLLISAAVQCVEVILQKIIENLPAILGGGVQLLLALANGIVGAIPTLIGMLPQVITAIITVLTDNLPLIIESGIQIIIALAGGLIEAIPELVSHIPEIVTAIVQGFTNAASRFLEIGKNIVRGVWEGIKSMGKWIGDKVSGFFSGIVDGAKNLLGIHSPSKVFAGIGKYMAEGLGEGWDDEFSAVSKRINSGLSFNAGKLAYAGAGTLDNAGGVSSGGITIVQNISAVPQTPIQIAAATEAYFEQARWAL